MVSLAVHLADLTKMKRQLADAHSSEIRHRAEARRFEEASIRARKEADRQSAKVNAVASGNVTTREMELEQKYEKCMVSINEYILPCWRLVFHRNFLDVPHANRV